MNRTCPKWFCPIDALSGNAPSELDTWPIIIIAFSLECCVICHSVAQVAAIDIPASLIDFFLYIAYNIQLLFFSPSQYASEEKRIKRSERLEKLHQVCCRLIHHKLALFPPDVKDKDHRDFVQHWYLFIIHRQLLDNNKHVAVVDQFLKFNVLFEFDCLHFFLQIGMRFSVRVALNQSPVVKLLRNCSIRLLSVSVSVSNLLFLSAAVQLREIILQNLNLELVAALIVNNENDELNLFFTYSNTAGRDAQLSSWFIYDHLVKLLLLLHSGSQGWEWGAEVKLKNSSLGEERYHLESSERHYWWN
ncbi:hypothetical protein T01_268 [Trichinella spiralis]|uniref:Uncharacterized protein n=1 Tax=Trichinella spiralis TaxID=6334 RepID=A0A0V1C236_TRISP|nr:hypothetical protein T01_268 [Trichinella spiralis]